MPDQDTAAAVLEAPAEAAAAEEREWTIVEIMGHRSHAGAIREIERFGAKLIRIDVFGAEGDAYASHDYSGAAIFSLTPTDEATARRYGERAKPTPRPLLTAPRPADDLDEEIPY